MLTLDKLIEELQDMRTNSAFGALPVVMQWQHHRPIPENRERPLEHVHLMSYAERVEEPFVCLSDCTRNPTDSEVLADEFEKNRELPAAYSYLGRLLQDKGLLDEAIACYRKAIELDPKDPRYHVNLGCVLSAQKKLDEAIACYRKAIELDPNDATAHYLLAWILATGSDLKLRDPGLALQHALIAVELRSRWHVSWSVLGCAFYRTGAWNDSIEALEESIMLQKDRADPCHCFLLAMANWKLDQKAEARYWYDRSIAWMEKHQPNKEECSRFRAEAEQLLEVKK